MQKVPKPTRYYLSGLPRFPPPHKIQRHSPDSQMLVTLPQKPVVPHNLLSLFI
jgi:hypothetical protein